MKTTRRTFLGGIAAASVPAGTSIAAFPSETAQENPDLLAAYDRFLASRDEVVAANDALEWLVDEWRHLWPPAPIEILGFANADEYTETAERDIAGHIRERDTAELRRKFTAEWLEKHPRACFSVNPPEWLQETIKAWEKPRTGKTEKALARNLAQQSKVLSEYRQKHRLSEEYHAETARLREASGVEQVKRRIETAEAELDRACTDVSYEPARTIHGLRLKAEVLQVQDDGMAIYMRGKGGSLGGMARFIDSALDVIGRASA